MLNHVKVSDLNDYFKNLESRPERGVYFYRIAGFNEDIGRFIRSYYEASRKTGVVIEGRIQNPDDRNLAYYNEMMGMNFQLSLGFISSSLKKWLPRMNDYQRQTVATSIYDSLDSMRKMGKNDNMLKNAYIKFMCWLYYKFERIVSQLGNNNVPKILYDGDISNYELMLISILSNAGCDVVLLEYKGDANYLKHDPKSLLSDLLQVGNAGSFPNGYNLKFVQKEIQEEFDRQRLYGVLPTLSDCANVWIKGKNVLDDIRTPAAMRGEDKSLIYNCFCRINGVEDKLFYAEELHKFYKELVASKRKVVVIDGMIPAATMEEINSVQRHSKYQNVNQMLMDLTKNILYSMNMELQRLMVKSFIDVMLEEGSNNDANMNRLINKGVYLLCWMKRYQMMLFGNWKYPEVECFIHMGACKNENEILFLKFLSRLPVDVLILAPNLNETCALHDKRLYERNYMDSLNISHFPKEAADLHIGTSAYHAERELDTLMYQDSGMYRNQQYAKADAVTLQTMFEEIKILWKEEVKYRPGFGTENGIVKLPVIFSKVSGVKNGDINAYWNGVREFLQEDVFLVKDVPFIAEGSPNQMKAFATDFLKNGRVQKGKIKNHKSYRYGFLREEVQEHILDKLQVLIDKRMVKGIFENGTEYTVVATVLNLDNDLLRKIQNFDFTKKNPKLVYINTGEKMISLEDSIVITFLNLIGFDVLLFVPTGYLTVEKYFNNSLMEEHQIGDYAYDLQIPDLNKAIPRQGKSWRDRIFRRI